MNGKSKTLLVHRLVANAFLNFDLNSKFQINHIDGNKLNNHVTNIEICDNSFNQKHKVYSLGNGSFNKLDNNLFEMMLIDFADGKSIGFLSKKYQLSMSGISQLLRNRLKNIDLMNSNHHKKLLLIGFSKSKRSKFRFMAKDQWRSFIGDESNSSEIPNSSAESETL